MKAFSPFASRTTWPFAETKVSVYAELNFMGAPDVVIQIPLDKKADVIEYAANTSESMHLTLRIIIPVKTLYAVGEVLLAVNNMEDQLDNFAGPTV